MPTPPKEGQLSGQTLASVKIGSLLGQGAMGEVYKGRHEILEIDVAVKVIHAALADREELVNRFKREAQATVRLEHPNILRVYSAEKKDDLYFIVMEFIDGSDLRKLLKKYKRISWPQATALVAQAAAGLAHAHDRGVVHRDIKPENLMLTRKGDVKVADFGLAQVRAAATSITMSGEVLGTPLYMSPEQCQAAAVDHRADVYALGATFYHLVAGRPPHVGESAAAIIAQHVLNEVQFPEKYFHDVPKPLQDLIREMMIRAPEKRLGDLNVVRQQCLDIRAAGAENAVLARSKSEELSPTRLRPSPLPSTPASQAELPSDAEQFQGVVPEPAVQKVSLAESTPDFTPAAGDSTPPPPVAASATPVANTSPSPPPLPSEHEASAPAARQPEAPGGTPLAMYGFMEDDVYRARTKRSTSTSAPAPWERHREVQAQSGPAANYPTPGNTNLAYSMPPKKVKRGRGGVGILGCLIVLGILAGGGYYLWDQGYLKNILPEAGPSDTPTPDSIPESALDEGWLVYYAVGDHLMRVRSDGASEPVLPREFRGLSHLAVDPAQEELFFLCREPVEPGGDPTRAVWSLLLDTQTPDAFPFAPQPGVFGPICPLGDQRVLALLIGGHVVRIQRVPTGTRRDPCVAPDGVPAIHDFDLAGDRIVLQAGEVGAPMHLYLSDPALADAERIAAVDYGIAPRLSSDGTMLAYLKRREQFPPPDGEEPEPPSWRLVVMRLHDDVPPEHWAPMEVLIAGRLDLAGGLAWLPGGELVVGATQGEGYNLFVLSLPQSRTDTVTARPLLPEPVPEPIDYLVAVEAP